MQGSMESGGRQWSVRGDSRLSAWGLVVCWLLLAAAGGLFYGALRASYVINTMLAVVFGSFALIRGSSLGWKARGERYGVDLDSGEIFGRWNRWPLTSFRAVELRHVIGDVEARHLWRTRGWRVVMVEGLGDSGLTVYESPHDLRAWRVAERFARSAGLPMIDASGNSPMTRHSHELDVTLLERLRGLEAAPDPGPPPDGLDLTVDEGRLRLETRVLPFGFLITGLLTGAVVAAPFVMVWPWAFLLLPALGALVMVIAVPTGACRLEVDGERIVVTGPIFRGRRSMEIARIESIRLFGEGAHSQVCFVSDAAIVSLPLRADDFGWLRDRLFHRWTTGEGEGAPRVAIYR